MVHSWASGPSPCHDDGMKKSDLPAIVEEIERTCKWDQPTRLFSLVYTQKLLGTPDLPADVEAGIRANWDGSSDHLSAVEQELESNTNEEELLSGIVWPEQVDGAVLYVERLIVPSEVEAQAPDDPQQAAEFIANHEARMDVRLVVGVLRSGDSWCAMRMRMFDDDGSVAKGVDLVPEMVELLKIGFMTNEELQRQRG